MAASELAWEALADPTRRTILRVLANHGELAAGEVAAEVTNVGRTAVSAQLRVLRAAGLVEERRVGRNRMYTLRPGVPDEVVQFIASLYSGSLSELKRQVAAQNKRKPRAGANGSRPAR